MRLATFAIVLLALTPHAEADPTRHLRIVDTVLAALTEQGARRSESFRALIDRVEGSDWLVFIQRGRCPDRSLVGCLVHDVGIYEGRPYLRVLIEPEGRHPDLVISTLAHELQHALEAVSGGVTDRASMKALFRRLASERIKTSRATIYETREARRIEDLVVRELLRRD
jgi:hypothetical protein